MKCVFWFDLQVFFWFYGFQLYCIATGVFPPQEDHYCWGFGENIVSSTVMSYRFIVWEPEAKKMVRIEVKVCNPDDLPLKLLVNPPPIKPPTPYTLQLLLPLLCLLLCSLQCKVLIIVSILIVVTSHLSQPYAHLALVPLSADTISSPSPLTTPPVANLQQLVTTWLADQHLCL